MMGFREIREINENEKIKSKKEEEFLKIKPENGMTFAEAEAFWEAEFKKMASGGED